LSGKHAYTYTDAEYQAFCRHLEKIQEYPEELRDILLHIYANPVLRGL